MVFKIGSLLYIGSLANNLGLAMQKLGMVVPNHAYNYLKRYFKSL